MAVAQHRVLSAKIGTPVTGPLSGYLLAAPDERPIARRALDDSDTQRFTAPHLKFHGAYENLKFWEEYIFFSDREFIEDASGAIKKPPFKYSIYCARSASKLIILSEK